MVLVFEKKRGPKSYEFFYVIRENGKSIKQELLKIDRKRIEEFSVVMGEILNDYRA